MTYINTEGYVARQIKSGRRKSNDKSKKDWWIVKYDGRYAMIVLNRVRVPSYYLGKKVHVKLQLEVIDDITKEGVEA